MEWLPPGSWILFVRGASIVRGEGRRPDEEECGFGGVDVRSLLRLPAAAQCPAALGKRGPPLVELAPLPPSCLLSLPAFSFAPSASHLQGALAYTVRPKQPSSHTCCQGKVSCLEGSLHARGSLLCLPAAEMPTRLLPRKFVGYHGRDQNHPGSAMPLRDASDVLYQNPKAWFWLPCPAAS